MGTVVYIPELDGGENGEAGDLGDGCFVVEDRGLRVQGDHVDLHRSFGADGCVERACSEQPRRHGHRAGTTLRPHGVALTGLSSGRPRRRAARSRLSRYADGSMLPLQGRSAAAIVVLLTLYACSSNGEDEGGSKKDDPRAFPGGPATSEDGGITPNDKRGDATSDGALDDADSGLRADADASVDANPPQPAVRFIGRFDSKRSCRSQGGLAGRAHSRTLLRERR